MGTDYYDMKEVDDMSGFKNVVGHRDIIQYIQDAVGQNKVSHAYILNGQRG